VSLVLKVQPLEAAAFAPFGQVLEHRPGDHPRRNYAADLFSNRPRAVPNLRVQRTEPALLPLVATRIERHRHSSQMFAPLSGGSFLVVVFPSDAERQPVLHQGRAFAANGHQAINYNCETWHHPFVAINGPGTFLMLRWEDGTAGDEEFLSLPDPIRIEL
jgi:ureidoglycolate lyase